VNPEVYAALQTAGDNLQPVTHWVAANWINLAIAASFLAVGIQIIRWVIRNRRHVPAAPDNVPPVDVDDLIICRRIDRQPLTDPDISRRSMRYQREQQRKEKP
jgi:hypothetical protein